VLSREEWTSSGPNCLLSAQFNTRCKLLAQATLLP
jgi:hypothetical protein